MHALGLSGGDLLACALTHPSFAGEQAHVLHNQRLEYLGDAVLQLVIAHYLYESIPHLGEGALTKARARIVSRPPLAKTARELEIGAHLRMSAGEEKSGGREKDSVLADAMEALFAVVYLEQGFEKAKQCVLRVLAPRISEALAHLSEEDSKTALQELLQKDGQQVRYQLLSSDGPAHAPVFSTAVFSGQQELGRGQGGSRKQSEQAAARDALSRLRG